MMPTMPGISTGLSTGRADIVARMAVGVMTLMLVVMLGRVAQLQLAPSKQLSDHLNARVAHRVVAAPRGDFVDRRMRPLVSSEFGYRVFVDPTELPSPPDEAIQRLADTIGVSPGEIGPKIIRAIAKNRQLVPPAAETPAAPRGHGMKAMWAGLKSLGEAITSTASDEPPGPDDPPAAAKKPLRYVRVSDVLDDATVDAVKKLKIAGIHLEQRGVRDYSSGALAASIIGKVNVDGAGVLGAELAHQKELIGANGRITYIRDAMGRPLWIGPGSYDQPKRGGDVRLSIDMEIQRLTAEELQRAVNEYDAGGGRAIVMDVATGEILAMVDVLRPTPDAIPYPWPDAPPPSSGRSGAVHESFEPIPRARYIVIKPDLARLIHPSLGRNRCIEDIYEPGSTFKPFVWATITEAGAFKVTDVLNTGNGHWTTPYGRLLHDVHPHPTLTWRDVLVQSSNIGMAQGAERLTHDQLYKAIRRFGFGSKPGLGLAGETPGMVTPRSFWSNYTQTSVAFGQEVAVTPVQMARAFSALARSGEMMGTLPPARLTAADPADADDSVVHRVLRPDAVMLTRSALVEVAEQMEGKMAVNKDHPESGWRYSIFGKSGTAQIPLGKAPKGKRRPPKVGYYEHQYNASFIAAGPGEDPKLVVLVVIDDPGPELVHHNVYYGALTAGPVVRRVMERSLAYLGVAPSPPRTSSLKSLGNGPIPD